MLDIRHVSDSALMLYLGEAVSPAVADRVQAAVALIEQALGSELIDLVPSYASILVVYDPFQTSHTELARQLRNALAGLDQAASSSGRTVTLPVYYAPESGADLQALAQRSGLTADEVIALHTGTEYRAYAIGFAPGFAYLGEVDERIAAPRLSTPRTAVPQGSVAIADRQTAVYPAPSPGGWNLIGRCPLKLFDPEADPSMPVAVGDRVRFEAISRDTYLSLGGKLS